MNLKNKNKHKRDSKKKKLPELNGASSMYTILILFVPRYNLATMIHCPYLLLRFLRYDQFSTQLTFHTLI